MYKVQCKYTADGQCRAGEGCMPFMKGISDCPRMADGLERFFNPAQEITIKWNIEDVWTAIQDKNVCCYALDDSELLDVLHDVQDNHDANCGVTWDTLAESAEMMFGEEREFLKSKDA